MFAFFDDFVRGVPHHDAAQPQAAAGVRAAADLHDVGVADDEAHFFNRYVMFQLYLKSNMLAAK